MRSLERRVRTLEGDHRDDGDRSLVLDRLSDAELNRLEALVVARDAGEWSDVSELADDDLRILASIRVAGEPA